jgi:polar amino acid transport system substrate-binding protein
MGSVHDTYAKKNYPEAEILQYASTSDMLMALETDKVDGVFYDHAALKEVLVSYKTLGVLAENVFTLPIAAGFNSDDDELRNQFNNFLKEIKTNGIYADMTSRWLDKDITDMPEIIGSGENGELRVGVVNDLGKPFSFIQSGELIRI